jgi:hypothetical protein
MSEWVSTARAAAALGVSERTILRRAAAGKLESRKETTARGVMVVVALDTANVPTGADIVRTGADTQATLETPSNGVEVPTGADRGADRGADTDLTTHLLDENRFLRGVIEQLQRDGAEVRAALRDALKVMPKAITSGAADSAPEPPKKAADRADEPTHAPPADASQNGPDSGAATSYAAIADWLEKEME